MFWQDAVLVQHEQMASSRIHNLQVWIRRQERIEGFLVFVFGVLFRRFML